MPSWWGKSSSKDVKKKTSKGDFFVTIQRFISSTEQRSNAKSLMTRIRNRDISSEKGSHSRLGSRSTSPSTQVSRCQSFADRPVAQPLPIPELDLGVTRTRSNISVSKPMLEKRGRPPLFLPLPTPDRFTRKATNNDIDADLTTASVSSNCSIDDSDDQADSRLHSPVGNGFDNGSRVIVNKHSWYGFYFLFVAMFNDILFSIVTDTPQFVMKEHFGRRLLTLRLKFNRPPPNLSLKFGERLPSVV